MYENADLSDSLNGTAKNGYAQGAQTAGIGSIQHRPADKKVRS